MTHLSNTLELLKKEFCDFIDLLNGEIDTTPDLIPYSTLEEIMKLIKDISEERTIAIDKINNKNIQFINSDYNKLKEKVKSLNESPQVKENLLECLHENIFTDKQFNIILNLLSLKNKTSSKKEREKKEYEDMENMLDYLNKIREYKRHYSN